MFEMSTFEKKTPIKMPGEIKKSIDAKDLQRKAVESLQNDINALWDSGQLTDEDVAEIGKALDKRRGSEATH